MWAQQHDVSTGSEMFTWTFFQSPKRNGVFFVSQKNCRMIWKRISSIRCRNSWKITKKFYAISNIVHALHRPDFFLHVGPTFSAFLHCFSYGILTLHNSLCCSPSSFGLMYERTNRATACDGGEGPETKPLCPCLLATPKPRPLSLFS